METKHDYAASPNLIPAEHLSSTSQSLRGESPNFPQTNPASAAHSEPSPLSLLHTSLIFACQRLLVSCWAWSMLLSGLGQPSAHLYFYLSLALLGVPNLQGPFSWSSGLCSPSFLMFSTSQLMLHVFLFAYCLLSLIKCKFWEVRTLCL